METQTININEYKEVNFNTLFLSNSFEILSLLDQFSGLYCKIPGSQNNYILIRTSYFNLNKDDNNGQLFYFTEIHNKLPDYKDSTKSLTKSIAMLKEKDFDYLLYLLLKELAELCDNHAVIFLIRQLDVLYKTTKEKETKNSIKSIFLRFNLESQKEILDKSSVP